MASEPTTCRDCGRPGPVELQMTVKGGQELTMLSCMRCEGRTWLADGEPISRAEALRLTSGDPDFVQTPLVRADRKAPRAEREVK